MSLEVGHFTLHPRRPTLPPYRRRLTNKHSPSSTLPSRKNCSTCISTSSSIPRSNASDTETLTAADIDDRIKVVINTLETADKLLPYDPEEGNLGINIWKSIREIPIEHKTELLRYMSSTNIRRLWDIAGKRYSVNNTTIARMVNTSSTSSSSSTSMLEYSFGDLPNSPDGIVYYKGKAALNLPIIRRFRKAFWISPKGSSSSNREICGRVFTGGPIGSHLYPGPLYFKADITTEFVPITRDVCDAVLHYDRDDFDIKELPLREEALSWPRPRGASLLFGQGFTDYVRLAGPGVIVGLGYRTKEKEGGGLLPGSRANPLYFVMCREQSEREREG